MVKYFCGTVMATFFLVSAIQMASAQTPITILGFEFVEEMRDPRTESDDRRRLLLVNEEFGRQMRSCAAFRVVDGTAAQTLIEQARSRMAYLHRCNGCAGEIGQAVSVDLVLFPWVQKVSNLILNLNAEIHNASSGQVVAARSVDIRGNTDRGWLRGTRALARRLCELDGERLIQFRNR